MKVIGAGFGRTGTTSLKAALERLLVYNVREGWGPLCEFLDVPEPEEPFPRLNDAAQLPRGMKAVRALATVAPVALPLSIGAALVLLRKRAGC